MRNRIQRFWRDERGISTMLVGFGMVGFLGATTLALDIGMNVVAKTQAQSAADAGALAGAVALGFNDFNDRSATGPAVQSAINAARENAVMNGMVDVDPPDVTFPLSPTGANNRVRAYVSRTVPTVLGWMFNMPTVLIQAAAIAEAAPANAMTCVKPFIIPDRWLDSTTGTYATQADEFQMYDNQKNLLPNPDTYIGSGPNYTGYNNIANKGMRLTLRAANGTKIYTSFYFSLAIGGNTGGNSGAAAYEWNIANCNKTIMHIGEIAIQEPGNMMGPTVAGAADLIAKDPTAYWDTAKNRLVSTYQGQSPRVFPIPLYDPIFYEQGKQNGRYADFKVANWIGFFLESTAGNEIYGRIIPIAGIADTNYATPDSAFPIAIRLVG